MTAPAHIRQLALALVAVLTAAALVEAQASPYGLLPKARYKKYTSQIGGFELEYPDTRQWKIVLGHPDVSVSIVETGTGNAAVVVQRSSLRGALTPEEVAIAADDEVAGIKERQPSATGVQREVRDAGGRRFYTVQYVKAGAKGPEQIVQYVFPVGTAIYRVTCTALQTEYTKFAPVFGHVAASFKATAAAAPTKN